MSRSRIPKQGPQAVHGCAAGAYRVPKQCMAVEHVPVKSPSSVPKHCMAMEQVLSIPQPAEQRPEQFPCSGHVWGSVGVSSSCPPRRGTAGPGLIGEGTRRGLMPGAAACPRSAPVPTVVRMLLARWA